MIETSIPSWSIVIFIFLTGWLLFSIENYDDDE